MTEFGDKMKTYEQDLDTNIILSNIEAKKKQNKERKYEYKFEVSGIDMFATRRVNNKDTSTLIIMLSKTNANGLPICYIKLKDGTNVEISDATLKSFTDGLANATQFPSKRVATGCVAIPWLSRDKEFNIGLPYFLKNKLLVDLTRQGLMTFDIFYRSRTETYWNSSIKTPWYGSNDRYAQLYTVFERTAKDIYDPETKQTVTIEKYPNFNEANLHMKLVKEMLKYATDVYGASHSDAIESLYTNNSTPIRRTKAITNDLVKAFVTIANRYDEPFAIKCFHEYMDDGNLDGLSANSLDSLFRLDITATKMSKVNGYGRTFTPTFVSGSFTYLDKMDRMNESNIIQLDKNRMWEYILQSTCVGKGRSLSDYIELWRDYLSMALSIDGKIKDKYPEAIQVAHDIYSNEYTEIQKFAEDDKLFEMTEKAKDYCDYKTKDGWQFNILRTQKEFVDEAKQNSNCVASYVDRVINGNCWIGSFRPIGADTTILTVEVRPESGRFVQIKGKFNRNATRNELALLKKVQAHVFKKMIEAGVLTKENATFPQCFVEIRNATLDDDE